MHCAKLGQAAGSLARRLAVYRRDLKLCRVPVVKGSQELRLAIFGDDETMLSEKQIKAEAKPVGTPLRLREPGQTKLGRVSARPLSGPIIEPIYKFAQHQASGYH